MPGSGRFTLGIDPVLIVQEAWWAPGSVWTWVQKFSFPLGFDHRTAQPVASRYTDCAIPAHTHLLYLFNPLKAELNPICHLLALAGAHHFVHVSRVRVKKGTWAEEMQN